MSLGLWLRFLASCVLLRFAATWAALWRGSVRGELRALNLEPTSAATRFGFDGPFDFPTVASLPAAERYPWKVGVAKVLVVSALRIPLRSARRWRSLAEVDELYALLPRPALLDQPDDDRTFGRLRVQGPNPGWIRRNTSTFPGMWMVDYRALLEGLPVHPDRWLAPCIALFHSDLLPAGIEIDGAWYAPGTAAWPEARRCFHVADVMVHEAVSHLLWTHLHAEAAIVATSRLPPDHPVRRLLSPSMAFTLQANENSGGVLLGRGGLFERVFSAGWAGTAELLARGEAAWRFARCVPPLDAAERGVDSLEPYPWREDALLLWEAVHLHVEARLGEVDDAALAWGRELHGRFAGRGWPAPTDRAGLVLAVAACLFATVRHTFVNAAQYDSFGYPPRWPTSLFRRAAGLPRCPDDLPDVGQTLDTIRATFAFSIQYSRFSGGPELRLQLDHIAGIIAERNQRRAWAYTRASPERVSGSINA